MLYRVSQVRCYKHRGEVGYSKSTRNHIGIRSWKHLPDAVRGHWIDVGVSSVLLSQLHFAFRIFRHIIQGNERTQRRKKEGVYYSLFINIKIKVTKGKYIQLKSNEVFELMTTPACDAGLTSSLHGNSNIRKHSRNVLDFSDSCNVVCYKVLGAVNGGFVDKGFHAPPEEVIHTR